MDLANVWPAMSFFGGSHDKSRLVTGRPEDEAMERYAAGDEAAFAVVYDAVAPRLHAYLVRLTRSDARADDLLQQTMLKIHLARGTFLPGAAVRPWAYAIARRLFLDSLRRGRREVPLGDEEDTRADGAAGADELAVAEQLAARIERELAKLPENQRVAFQLVKQEELGIAEAAAILGTTVAAVKLRAHRAYQALRAALGSEGDL